MVQPVNFLQNFDRSPLQTVAANVNALQGNVQNANLLQQQALQNQAAQAQQELAQQFQTDFQGALESGDILGLTTKYPQFSERIKQVNNFRQGLIDSGAGRVASQIVNAIDRKDSRGVFNLLEENKDVINSFGDPNFSFENARQMMIENPEQFRALAKSTADLAGVQTGSISDLEQAKLALEEKKLKESRKPKPISSFQEQSLALRRSEQALEMLKLEAQNETNKLRQDELNIKIKERQQDLDSDIVKFNDAASAYNSAYSTVIDSGQESLKLVNNILKSPGFDGYFGVQETAGTGFGFFEPLRGSPEADTQSMVETLESQNFLTSIQDFKAAGGAGSLSDAEGKKLSAALTNLTSRQSEKQARQSLETIKRIINRGMTKAKKSFKRRELKPVGQQAQPVQQSNIQTFTSPSGITFTVE
jgi:hypothetical protein